MSCLSTHTFFTLIQNVQETKSCCVQANQEAGLLNPIQKDEQVNYFPSNVEHTEEVRFLAVSIMAAICSTQVNVCRAHPHIRFASLSWTFHLSQETLCCCPLDVKSLN